ncbi:LacI family DNA-binding transcriptional regulator [Spirillospora sp. NPDC047279]|uniref:LacI family DNA-binding transcriptional regulator n=1 Tax=Spirillospora sp. NPDC047279 TaxID=3155478 RepID=UPI0033DF7E7B
MVTSRDVASAAKVSQATVSRTLSGAGGVSAETRARVLAAAAELGYELNHAARTMRTQRSGTIGVVVDRVTNPFYPEVIESLSRTLDDLDLRMILWDSQGAGEKGAIQAIGHKMIDGLIFTTATSTSSALTTALKAGAPLVLVNRVVEGMGCDQVDSDNAVRSSQVAHYFAAAGRTRAGLITGSGGASTAHDRKEGFLAGAARHGVDVPDEFVLDGRFSHSGGYEALRAIFESPQPPTAVFCSNDLSAFGAVDAARSMGLTVPDDLWIVGYDDVDMASWESFSLTTVRQPVEEMVRAGVHLLLERIDNPKKSWTHQRFTSELIVRDSTGRTPFPGAP